MLLYKKEYNKLQDLCNSMQDKLLVLKLLFMPWKICRYWYACSSLDWCWWCTQLLKSWGNAVWFEIYLPHHCCLHNQLLCYSIKSAQCHCERNTLERQLWLDISGSIRIRHSNLNATTVAFADFSHCWISLKTAETT